MPQGLPRFRKSPACGTTALRCYLARGRGGTRRSLPSRLTRAIAFRKGISEPPIGRLQAQEHPPILLRRCIPGERHMMGCRVDISVKPLEGTAVKEGLSASPLEQAVHRPYAERRHIALVAPGAQAFFHREGLIAPPPF